MEDKTEIQNSEFIVAGGLGTVQIASIGKFCDISKIETNKRDGTVTITLSKAIEHYIEGMPIIEDADFEIIQPKLIEDKKQQP